MCRRSCCVRARRLRGEGRNVTGRFVIVHPGADHTPSPPHSSPRPHSPSCLRRRHRSCCCCPEPPCSPPCPAPSCAHPPDHCAHLPSRLRDGRPQIRHPAPAAPADADDEEPVVPLHWPHGDAGVVPPSPSSCVDEGELEEEEGEGTLLKVPSGGGGVLREGSGAHGPQGLLRVNVLGGRGAGEEPPVRREKPAEEGWGWGGSGVGWTG